MTLAGAWPGIRNEILGRGRNVAKATKAIVTGSEMEPIMTRRQIAMMWVAASLFGIFAFAYAVNLTRF